MSGLREGKETVNLVQCIHRTMKPATTQSVVQTILTSGYDIAWTFGFDADIGRSRSLKASEFLWNPSLGDVMVFIDDDISYEVQGFRDLVELCKETKAIACGMYVVRDTAQPHPALALWPGQYIDLVGEPTKVKYGATGFMAIHRKALEKIEREYPWGYPVPLVSGPRTLMPFFMEIERDGEYLSEDYSFSARAYDVGIPTWCDPRIPLAHNGERAYILQDLKHDAFKQVTTLTINEGGPDPTGILTDLSEYLGRTRLDVWREMCTTDFRAKLAEEWGKANPVSIRDHHAFYSEAENYVMDLAKFNTNPLYVTKTHNAIKAQGKVVDFGGGIGTYSLQMDRNGRQMTYVDLPSQHRDFAEWRFLRHNRNITTATYLSELADGEFDALVAIDVFEYISPDEIKDVISQISRILKPGGLLMDTNNFEKNDSMAQHYDHGEIWDALLAGAGFELAGTHWVKTAWDRVHV